MDETLFFSSKSNYWCTPDYVYAPLHKEFGFQLDPCCTEQSAKCAEHFTEKEDGLKSSWGGGRHL